MAAVNADADGTWSAMPNGNRVNNARQGRALIQSLFLGGSTTSPLSAVRSGVISTASDGTQAYDLRVTVQSGRTLLVQPGSAIIGRSGQGGYLSWELPAARSVTCDTPPASNPRNDIVVFRNYDTLQGDTIPASGGIPARIEIITGTPGAVPVDPVTWDGLGLISSWPAAASGGGTGIPLARARVATDGTVTLTDIRRSTAPIGGVRVLLPGDSLTDPSYMPGDLSWYNGLRVWDGTTWRGITPKQYQTATFATQSNVSAFPCVLGSVAIPDPGWPYRLKFDAMVAMSSGTSGGFDFVPRDGSASGANLAGPLSIAPTDGRAGGTNPVPYTYNAASDAVLTGGRTVYMVVNRWTGVGNNIGINGGPGNRLTVTVNPA
ncbi:hypothetical protein ACFORO_25925 [Amycolatopsis halotolerans]|uniref:Uncharacterized protein n=1 Tax=Amycolatopsis halotolerans TaxID=330083 RepID=A0ABV7QMR8_9PSEU